MPPRGTGHTAAAGQGTAGRAQPDAEAMDSFCTVPHAQYRHDITNPQNSIYEPCSTVPSESANRFIIWLIPCEDEQHYHAASDTVHMSLFYFPACARNRVLYSVPLATANNRGTPGTT